MKKQKLETVKEQLNLVYDFGAITYLNNEHKINLIDGSLKDEDFKNPSFYGTMLQAGLLHEFEDDAEAALKAVKEKTKGIPVGLIIQTINAAIKDATGNDDDESPEETTSEAASDASESE